MSHPSQHALRVISSYSFHNGGWKEGGRGDISRFFNSLSLTTAAIGKLNHYCFVKIEHKSAFLAEFGVNLLYCICQTRPFCPRTRLIVSALSKKAWSSNSEQTVHNNSLLEGLTF